jgi:AcrR family transcriptional regulator
MEAIVAAAAIELADEGFDRARVEKIAARAKTSVGSLYQFFPDKAALFRALAERCLEQTRVTFELFMAESPVRPWRETLTLLVDGIAALHENDPNFRAVLGNLDHYELFADADASLHEAIVSQIARQLRTVVDLPRARCEEVARTAVVALTATLVASRKLEPRARAAALAETKTMLERYIAGYEVSDRGATAPRESRREGARTRRSRRAAATRR